MDFDENGIPTVPSLLLLEELVRTEIKANEAYEHNMDVKRVAALGRDIVQHCLKAVAEHRDLLEQEGALNVEIGRFLKKSGLDIWKNDSNGNTYLRTVNADDEQRAVKFRRHQASTGVISDIVVDTNQDRVELKTAAYATPKDGVPDDLFDKDLTYLQKRPFDSDLESYPWEGLPRARRSAEMAVFACDKTIALGSARLADLVGDIAGTTTKVTHGHDGVTYEVYTGRYSDSEILYVDSARPKTIEEFIILLAIPSEKD